MPRMMRCLLCSIGVLVISGCHHTHSQAVYRQANFRAHQLYQQNLATQYQLQQAQHYSGQLAAEKDQLTAQNQGLLSEKQQLEMQNSTLTADVGELQASLGQLQSDNDKLSSTVDLANQRIENLRSERSKLREEYVSLLNDDSFHGGLLPRQATSRFEELARKYPNFEFDPETGIGKFHADILFPIGSDEVRPDAHQLLRDFAAVLNQPETSALNILVIGHTDDRRIAQETTRNLHPTNWHLSTNRANSVITLLSQFGVDGHRMGAAGYSMFKPLVANRDEATRTRNRRVEILVLAPDAEIAGWESPNQRQ